MELTKGGNKIPDGKKKYSTIVVGSASYYAHERNNESELLCAWDAYNDALVHAGKWISEYERIFEHSAKVYKTEYLGPAERTHIAGKAGINEFIVKQSVRVSVREVTNVVSCTAEVYEDWENKERESEKQGFESSPIQNSSSVTRPFFGQVPLSVYTIIMGHGANFTEAFDDLLVQLKLIKEYNNVAEGVCYTSVSLINSCDEFELLHGTENHIEAGVKITMPFVYEFEKPHLTDFHDVVEVHHL
jgi:hypothetical protein